METLLLFRRRGAVFLQTGQPTAIVRVFSSKHKRTRGRRRVEKEPMAMKGLLFVTLAAAPFVAVLLLSRRGYSLRRARAFISVE